MTVGKASTLQPDDIAVMDNLGSHKGKKVRAAIRKAGAHLIFLPNSPDLNPIEQVFAKLKHLLRKAGAQVRTVWLSQRRIWNCSVNRSEAAIIRTLSKTP